MVLVFVGAELVLYATQAKVGVAAAEQTGRGAPQYVPLRGCSHVLEMGP